MLEPTQLRLNRLYIRIYILWMNLFVMILGPFPVLIILNIRVYKRIIEFEQTLNDTLRVRTYAYTSYVMDAFLHRVELYFSRIS